MKTRILVLVLMTLSALAFGQTKHDIIVATVADRIATEAAGYVERRVAETGRTIYFVHLPSRFNFEQTARTIYFFVLLEPDIENVMAWRLGDTDPGAQRTHMKIISVGRKYAVWLYYYEDIDVLAVTKGGILTEY